MKALVLLLALAATAHADPIAIATDGDAPLTKLGFRLGIGRIPLDDTLSTSALTIGVEHPVLGRLRMLAEYDYLWLSSEPDAEMQTFASTGHRTHVGVRYAAAVKDLEVVKFYADVEAGGGVGLYDAPSGTQFAPHGFVGARVGYQLALPDPRASRTFETEFHIRALILEHGIGFGCGFGFFWGD